MASARFSSYIYVIFLWVWTTEELMLIKTSNTWWTAVTIWSMFCHSSWLRKETCSVCLFQVAAVCSKIQGLYWYLALNHHHADCLMIGPYHFPKPVPYRAWHSAPSLKFFKVIHYLLTSSSSFSRPFHRFSNNVVLEAIPTQELSNPVRLSPFYCMSDGSLRLDRLVYQTVVGIVVCLLQLSVYNREPFKFMYSLYYRVWYNDIVSPHRENLKKINYISCFVDDTWRNWDWESNDGLLRTRCLVRMLVGAGV
jgi:hypothetical protein